MEELSRRERLEPLGLHARRRRDAPAAAEAVLAIPDNRTADVREMHANLMRASGAETNPQQIAVREARDERGMRHGMTPALRDGPALALFGMTCDRCLDGDRSLAQMVPPGLGLEAL